MHSVSIIVPAYNAANFINRALAAALAQDGVDLEVIVVDDASKDATVSVVTGIAEIDSRVRLIAQELNGGPSCARNRGLEAARGDWIVFLDADDSMDRSRCMTLLDHADSAGLDMIADRIAYFDADAHCVTRLGPVFSGDELTIISPEKFLAESSFYPPHRFQVALSKFIIRKDFITQKAIRFDPNIRDNEDFVFYLQCLLAGGRAGLFRDPLYKYTSRLGDVSGVRSRNSRTVLDRAQVVRSVDVLLKSTELNVKVIKGLKERRRTAISFSAYELVVNDLKSQRLSKALIATLTTPKTWPYLWYTASKRLVARFVHSN